MLTNAPHTHTQNQKQTNPSIVYHCRRFTHTAKQKKMTFAIKKERKKKRKRKVEHHWKKYSYPKQTVANKQTRKVANEHIWTSEKRKQNKREIFHFTFLSSSRQINNKANKLKKLRKRATEVNRRILLLQKKRKESKCNSPHTNTHKRSDEEREGRK